MASIGYIGEFDAAVEQFASYETRIRQYFAANEIPAERQVSAFISTIGARGFRTLQDVLAPDDPTAATLDRICESLRNHYNPQPLQLSERFKLHKCVQGEQRSISEYIATLKSLTLTCGYDAAVLESTLRDIFIAGLRSSSIQLKLVAKPDTLTFKEACETAVQLETATKEVSRLTAAKSTAVNAVNTHQKRAGQHNQQRKHQQSGNTQPQQQRQGSSQRKPCFRCAGDHKPNTCRHKGTTCRYCNKQGHIENACISKARDTGTRPKVHVSQRRPQHATSHNSQSRGRIHQVADSYSESRSDDDEYIQTVGTTRHNSNKFLVTPTINGAKVEMEIDTGAGVSIIPHHTFTQLFPGHDLTPADKILRTYTNEVIHSVGMMMCNVKIHGQRRRLKLYVTKTGTNALLGREWLRALQLNWAEIKAIHTANTINNSATTQDVNTRLNDILNSHKQIFEPGYGNFKGTNAKFYLKPDAQPKFAKARNVPYALRAKVDDELN